MAKKTKNKKVEITDIHEIKECPDCASQNLVYNEERQQVICRDCGLIYEPLAPGLENQVETAHEFIPTKTVAAEKVMVTLGEEEPKKAKKKAKPKKKPKKKKKAVKKKLAKKKPKKKKSKKAAKKAKPKKKPAKKKPVKKAKPKKKVAKKKPVKKKTAKKKPVKKKKKQKTFFGHIKARLKQD